MALKARTSCQWGLVLCLRVWNTYFTSFLFILVGINESLKNCESANPSVVVTVFSSNTERWSIIFLQQQFLLMKKGKLSTVGSYKRFARLIRLTPQQDWTNLILWNRCFSIDFIWRHIHEKGKHLPEWFASGLNNVRNWTELNYSICERRRQV